MPIGRVVIPVTSVCYQSVAGMTSTLSANINRAQTIQVSFLCQSGTKFHIRLVHDSLKRLWMSNTHPSKMIVSDGNRSKVAFLNVRTIASTINEVLGR